VGELSQGQLENEKAERQDRVEAKRIQWREQELPDR
jgi:hypothetical protein